MFRTSITLLFTVSLFAACTGGSGDADNDASSTPVADADPNAPDADPNAPDGSSGGGGLTDAAITPPDAGGSGVVECGMETCALGSEECCIAGGGNFSCVAPGTCQGTSTSCDGPEDCSSAEVCCGSFAGVSCTDTCEGNSGELCHVPADCSTPGDMCCEFGPLSVCAPNCNGGGGLP